MGGPGSTGSVRRRGVRVNSEWGPCGPAKHDGALILPPSQAALVTTIALAGGAVAGWAVEFQIGAVLTLPLAVVFGILIGEAVVRTTCLRSSIRLLAAVCLSLLAAALGARLAVASYLLFNCTGVSPPLGPFYVIADLFYPTPIPGLALACVALGASGRIWWSDKGHRGRAA